MNPLGGFGATIQPETSRWGQHPGYTVVLDYSVSPAQNDRRGKLGSLQHSRFTICTFYDPSSLTAGVADGYHGKGPALLLPLEPDNWIPRIVDGSGGVDNVMALRLVADFQNKTSKKAHRGTMVIDEAKSQQWGWLDDSLIVVDATADCADNELAVGPNGFLSQVPVGQDPKSGGGGGNASVITGNLNRGALALNSCRNQGFIADTSYFGQLGHFLTPLSQKKKKGDVPTGGGGNRPPVPTTGNNTVPSVGTPVPTPAPRAVAQNQAPDFGGDFQPDAGLPGVGDTSVATDGGSPGGAVSDASGGSGASPDGAIQIPGAGTVAGGTWYAPGSEPPGTPPTTIDDPSAGDQGQLGVDLGNGGGGGINDPSAGDQGGLFGPDFGDPSAGDQGGLFGGDGGDAGGGGGGGGGGSSPGPGVDANGRPGVPLEWGLRWDTGFKVSDTKVARFVDHGDQHATMPSGDLALVLFYVKDDASAPKDDHIDPDANPNDNHPRVEKAVPKHEVVGYTRKKPAGGGNHYDYSYHHPPGSSSGSSGGSSGSSGSSSSSSSSSGSSSGSSSSSSSSGSSSSDASSASGPPSSRGGGDVGGPAPPSDPVPPIPGAGTVVGGTWYAPGYEPGANDSSGTIQSQSGWAAPHSPVNQIRTNVLTYHPTANACGTVVDFKPKGQGNVQVRLMVAISDFLNPGEAIEIRVQVGEQVNGREPTTWYRYCYVITTVYVPGAFQPLDFWFPKSFCGFQTQQDSMMSVMVMRMSNQTYGVNPSHAEVWVSRNGVYYPNSYYPYNMSLE